MRKLVLSINITIDGYIAGVDGELDWHFASWTSGMGEVLAEQLCNASTILLGKKTYLAMAAFWPRKALEITGNREDIAFACMMNAHRKVVFSSTLVQAVWDNSSIISGDLGKEVLRLKHCADTEKPIILIGSGSLSSGLIRLGLIDEYRLWVHPVILGKGRSLFNEKSPHLGMTLADSLTFPSGVVMLSYVRSVGN